VAKWLFVAMTVMSIGRSLTHMFLPDGGMQSIASIPMDAFSSEASAVVRYRSIRSTTKKSSSEFPPK
jgi:hypothetical protein